MLLPQCERPSFNGKNESSVYFDVYIYGKQTGREILYRMVADSPCGVTGLASGASPGGG